MQSLSGDLVTSDNQLAPWSTYPYGYSEFTMPGSDWITSLSTDLDGSPLTYDTELQHKDPYPSQLAAPMHRISPLDSPIEVAEADSTQHHSYPFSMHQHHHHGNHGVAADIHYHNQKQAQPATKLPTHAGARYVPHGYYNAGSRTSPSAGGPTLTQSSLYPSPPGQMLKHEDATAYHKPYHGLLYMNGDHVSQPMAYPESGVPFAAHPPGDLYQPYAVAPTPTYEEHLPSFQSVLPTGIESVLPTPKYDMWGTPSEPLVSPGSNPHHQTALPNGQCMMIKQEYMANYHSPSPSSLAGGSSVKTELMSDTSQSPPPLMGSGALPCIVPSVQTSPPQLLPPLSSGFMLDHKSPNQQDGGEAGVDGSLAANGKASVKKPARVTNHYGVQFVCPECERTFARQCGLTQHMKWHHSGDKPFRCITCGKCFSSEQSLAHHLERHTAVDKPHRCHVCPKAFFHKNDLRRHVYQHTGTAPHNCKYCQKAFARKDHCHSHEFSHERRVERQEKKSKARRRSEVAELQGNGTTTTAAGICLSPTIVPSSSAAATGVLTSLSNLQETPA